MSEQITEQQAANDWWNSLNEPIQFDCQVKYFAGTVCPIRPESILLIYRKEVIEPWTYSIREDEADDLCLKYFGTKSKELTNEQIFSVYHREVLDKETGPKTLGYKCPENHIECPTCKGFGMINNTDYLACWRCSGYGFVNQQVTANHSNNMEVKTAEEILNEYFHPKTTPIITKKAILNCMHEFSNQQTQSLLQEMEALRLEVLSLQK